MRNATVRLWCDDGKRISRMAVAGRPTPHTFAANEGSHVTPWAVFADSVRRGIIGHRAKSTIDHVRELIDALDDTERTEAKRLPTEQSSAFDTAADRAWE